MCEHSLSNCVLIVIILIDCARRYFRAIVLSEQGRDEESIAALDELLVREPANATAHFERGYSWYVFVVVCGGCCVGNRVDVYCCWYLSPSLLSCLTFDVTCRRLRRRRRLFASSLSRARVLLLFLSHSMMVSSKEAIESFTKCLFYRFNRPYAAYNNRGWSHESEGMPAEAEVRLCVCVC